jgi:hypothetical protein
MAEWPKYHMTAIYLFKLKSWICVRFLIKLETGQSP